MEPVLLARWFTDPFCSWSYAAEAAISRFRTHFGSRLRFEHRMFVLYRDLDAFLKNHHLERPRDFAPKILMVSKATGIPMTPAGWEREQVPRSTADCCRFVKAAFSVDPERGDRFLASIREAAFLEGKNIGDPDLLYKLAKEAGIGRPALETALSDPDISRRLEEDIELARTEGVTVRPTLILTNPGGDRVFIGGLRNSDLFILAGESLIEEAS